MCASRLLARLGYILFSASYSCHIHYYIGRSMSYYRGYITSDFRELLLSYTLGRSTSCYGGYQTSDFNDLLLSYTLLLRTVDELLQRLPHFSELLLLITLLPKTVDELLPRLPHIRLQRPTPVIYTAAYDGRLVAHYFFFKSARSHGCS